MADSKTRVLIAQTEFKPGGALEGIEGTGKGGRVVPGDVIEVDADGEQDKALRSSGLAVPVADGLRLQKAVLTEDGEDFTHSFFRPEDGPEGVLLLRRGTEGGPKPDDKASYDVIDASGVITNTRSGLASATRAAAEIGAPAKPADAAPAK